MNDLDAIRDLVAAGRFDAALKLLPGFAPSHGRAVLLAACHIGRKEGAKALAALADADSDAPETLFAAGRAHLLASNAHAAVLAFEELRARCPTFAGLAEALAGAYRRDARYEDAVRVVDESGAGTRQLRYEKAMALWRMGLAEQSLATFDRALELDPGHGASWLGGAAPALEMGGQAAAIARLERAVTCKQINGKYWSLLAAMHRLAGNDALAKRIREEQVDPYPRRRALTDGVEALAPFLAPGYHVFGTSRALLCHALDAARDPGLVLEFGVRRGTSINQIAERAGQMVHGFDSFEGLPETWIGERAGVLTTGQALPEVRPNVRLHAGWFEDTLPGFLASHAGPVRFVNIDSDIYASARTVLTALTPRIGVGGVLVFDEMIGNRTWRDDEYRAFREFVAETGIGWQVFALSPFTKQVAVRIVSRAAC